MQNLNILNRFRTTIPNWSAGTDKSLSVAFSIPNPTRPKVIISVIAQAADGWDHVSVSINEERCAYWHEMEFVRRAFFRPEECVIQIHPPLVDYINGDFPGGRSRFTLHLWRSHSSEVERPPLWMIGARSPEELGEFSEEAERVHTSRKK